MRTLLVMLCCLSAVACSADTFDAPSGRMCGSLSRAYSVPTSERVPYSRGTDDYWASLARTTPGGFGGYFIDNGKATIYLVDPSKKNAAFAALHAGGLFVDGAAVKRGRWDFAQLFDWMGYIAAHVASMRIVTTDDIDEAENRLAFGLRDSASIRSFDSTLTRLGIPCFLVTTSISNPVPADRTP